MKTRPNYLAGVGAFIWLAIVAVPLYVMLSATFQTRAEFGDNGPLSLPTSFTLQNYVDAVSSGFGLYFLNTVIVTVFYLINTVGLYDNLLGVILPTAAFALPICTIILSGTMRDITPELYEAMAMDGATPARSFLRLVLPLSKGGLSTIAVFSALQAWNGFLFPLILTQSESTRVVTLGLFNFQTQFGINIPGLLAAVTLSMVPVLLAYLFARRALVQGLMGAGGK